MKRLLRMFTGPWDYFLFFKMGGANYAKRIGVKIGENCRILNFINSNAEPFLIEIGNNVTITSGVRLLTHDGSTWLMNDEKGRRYLYRRIKIGSNVFIGVDSIIMPGIIIEDKVIVAAGSVVTKSVPSGAIVGGNPARVIGKYDEYIESGLKSLYSSRDFDKTIKYRDAIEKLVDPAFKQFMKAESK
jgi:acetyltransferase-like isoleucine patch superfamily enzyme